VNSYDCIEHLAAVPRVTSFPEHINSFPEHINQIFHDVFPEMDSLEQSLLAPMSLAPKTDVYEEADRIVLEMEAPGLKQEDLNLTLDHVRSS
jgi:HSP20 family protein